MDTPQFPHREKPAPRVSVAKSITSDKYDGLYGPILRSVDEYATRNIEDSFSSSYAATSGFAILTPPMPPEQLIKLPKLNNTLGQCVDAMVTNIDGFGWDLEEIGETGEKTDKDNPKAISERLRITELLQQPCDDQTFAEIRKRRRADYESVGWACLEVGRNNTGEIIWFRHIPAHTMRKTKRDAEPTKVKVKLMRNGKLTTIEVSKRLRRYVQQVGTKTVYFKEFRDRRVIDTKTGNPDETIRPEEGATEILWTDQYTAGENYGTPRWANNIPSVLGSRAAEMVNYTFFEDNAIPALAVMVSGGMLTSGTVTDLKNMFKKKGSTVMHKVLVIEAEPHDLGYAPDGKPSVPQLTMQALAKDRQSDGLFEKYLESCQVNIRSSFRLPPIFLGLSSDYTHATAASSLETAKSQVFVPEQEMFDALMNEMLLADLDDQPPKYWRFKSNPPKMTDSAIQVQAFTETGKLGGVSINDAIDMANQWLGRKTAKIEEPWAEWPIALVQAEIAKGNIKIPGVGDSDPLDSAGNPTDEEPVIPPTDPKAKENKTSEQE